MDENSQTLLVKFGAHLKSLRKQQGLTLIDVEIGSGISNGDLSRIERGKKNLTLTSLSKLAEGLGVSMSELVKF